MLQKQTGFRRTIKGFKEREGEKCVNSNREQVIFFFRLKFFTRFSSHVFVQGNHYFRGKAHAFFFPLRWAIFLVFRDKVFYFGLLLTVPNKTPNL